MARRSDDVPGIVEFPTALPARRRGKRWEVTVDDVDVSLSNLDKPYWAPEGYTKGDLLGYYYNAAEWILPYLRDRPLTLKRMPDGVDGEFFYAKQAPDHTPDWVATAPVTSVDDGKTIDYLLAQDTASLLWLANLGCIELHPWHARIDRIGRPDYAFFDLDPFDVPFATVREVALVVLTALDHLGLRGYPRTSGATGMQVYVPIERVHSADAVREFVERVCRLIHRADPDRTTMEWAVSARSGKVFLDYGMNTEGKNIAATYSLRPERGAPVATPLEWEEVEAGVEPGDFTIETIWGRFDDAGDLGAPILGGGQDLRAAMEAVGFDPDAEHPVHHVVGDTDTGGEDSHDVEAEEAGDNGHTPSEPQALARYRERRDFARTPEPAADADGAEEAAGDDAPRFAIQHHLASRLHHDLRLEHEGVAASWAVPKGLPDVPGVRHLAVQTEDHPLAYLDFSGDIPEGEYGAGPMRIWDTGTYDTLEWQDDKVRVRLHGQRHHGEFHLFRTDRDDPSQWLVVRSGDAEDLPPPPPRLRPMLAGDGGSAGFDDPDWGFEVKWDGVRAVATAVRPGTGEEGATQLISRAGNDITAAYPEIASLWERVLARNAVLDGELVALDPDGRPSFQRLQRRMHVRNTAAIDRLRRQVPVTYMVFDLLAVDGQELCKRPLSERLELLDGVLVPGRSVRRSEPVLEKGTSMFAAATEHGLEGVIAKRRSSVYRPGKRSRDWLKLKVRRRGECVIGGWLPGEGGRAGHLGSLLVGSYTDGRLRYMGRVGTGFDAAEIDYLEGVLSERTADEAPFEAGPAPPREGRWVRPELVCRVEYGEVTEEGVLRAPAYKGLVPDADPSNCTLEAFSS